MKIDSSPKSCAYTTMQCFSRGFFLSYIPEVWGIYVLVYRRISHARASPGGQCRGGFWRGDAERICSVLGVIDIGMGRRLGVEEYSVIGLADGFRGCWMIRCVFMYAIFGAVYK